MIVPCSRMTGIVTASERMDFGSRRLRRRLTGGCLRLWHAQACRHSPAPAQWREAATPQSPKSEARPLLMASARAEKPSPPASCRTSGGSSDSPPREAAHARAPRCGSPARRARMHRHDLGLAEAAAQARRGSAPAIPAGRSPPARRAACTIAAALRIQRSNSPSGMTCASRFSASGVARSCARVEGRVHDRRSRRRRRRARPPRAPCRSASTSAASSEARSVEMRVVRDAPASRRRMPAISGAFSTSTTVAPGQRDATARPAAPAPAPKSASRPAKPDGTAAASIIASMPARWPRALRLHQPEIAAVEGVDRRGWFDACRHGGRRSAVLDLVADAGIGEDARAPRRSSSASTMMRRGRMPIEPSSTLMFWSATRQSMPASRSSDFDEGDDDGVVGADEFFHARETRRLRRADVNAWCRSPASWPIGRANSPLAVACAVPP